MAWYGRYLNANDRQRQRSRFRYTSSPTTRLFSASTTIRQISPIRPQPRQLISVWCVRWNTLARLTSVSFISPASNTSYLTYCHDYHPVTRPNPQAPGGLDELPDDRDEHWALNAAPIRLPLIQSFPWTATDDAVNLTLPVMANYRTMMLDIHPDFVKRLQHGYLEDAIWRRTLIVVRENDHSP